MLRHRLPDLSHLALASPQAMQAALSAAAAPVSSFDPERSSELAVVEYYPKLAFVFNRMPASAFTPAQRSALQSIVQRFFGNRPSHGSFADAAQAQTKCATTSSASAAYKTPAMAADGEVVPVWLLPDSAAQAACSSHRGYRTEAEALRDELLSQRRKPFAKPLSERDWLRGISRMWEVLKRSALLSDYNRALQKLHCFA